MSRGLLGVALVCFLVASCQAKVFTATISTDGPEFIYLTKYAFDANCGPGEECTMLAEWTVTDNSSGYIAMYEENEWDLVVQADTCLDKITPAAAKEFARDFQFGPGSGNITFEINEHSTPHWWYAVIANCTGPMQVELTLTFLNRGSQFGFDEDGLLPIYVTFLVIDIVVLVLLLLLRKFSFFTYKVSAFVSVSLLVSAGSLLLSTLHWATYAATGVGVIGEGNWLRELSTCILLAGVLLGAAGWSQTAINNMGLWPRRIFIAFMIVIPALYVVLLVWSIAARNDWWFVDYLYETPPGSVLMAVRMVAGVWFAVQLYRTTATEFQAEKRALYQKFWVVGVLWLFLVPVMGFAGYDMPSYYQMKVITGLFLSIDTITTLVLLWLLRPSEAEAHFTTSGQVNASLGNIQPVVAPSSQLGETFLHARGSMEDQSL